jgi:hypothetical protein
VGWAATTTRRSGEKRNNPATTIINIKVARLDNFVMNSANIANEATSVREGKWLTRRRLLPTASVEDPVTNKIF